jgi:hypothetical protein
MRVSFEADWEVAILGTEMEPRLRGATVMTSKGQENLDMWQYPNKDT